MDLAAILVGRAVMDAELQKIIDERTTPWGVTVQSVEIRDVVIPEALEDAMSRQAQAERERQARVILGESEKQIADSFRQASEAYVDNPVALHLRAMNMLFEGLQERGALVIVPSSAVDTMNLGGLAGVTSLTGMAPQMSPKKDDD
jgi:regulator of protease activity HflC (stomatin/prohibitin superfamily)